MTYIATIGSPTARTRAYCVDLGSALVLVHARTRYAAETLAQRAGYSPRSVIKVPA